MIINATLRSATLLLAGLLLSSCATISSHEQSRISVDLKAECHKLYGSNVKDPAFGWDYVGWTGHNRVFAVGNASNGQQACGFAHDGVLGKSHNELASIALGICNGRMPGGVGCQVYAIDSNIVYSPFAAQTNLIPMNAPITNSAPTSSANSMNMQDAKNKCADLGFKPGTEGFATCVLRISK